MKKNAFIRKTVVLFLTIISVLGLQLISVNAKSPTYQQVPTMAYLKVESGQAYLSYANSAPQLFYEPMNGETVRLTQKICTGAWTDGKIFYYASGNRREPTKVSLYKYTIKTGKTEKLCTINKNCDLVGYSKNNFYLHTMGSGKQYLYAYNLKTKKITSKRIAYPVYNKNDVIGTGSLSDGRYIFVGDTYSGYSEFSGKYNCYPHSIYILDPVSQKFKLVKKMVTTETTKEKNLIYYASFSGTTSKPYSQIWKYNIKTGKKSAVGKKYSGIVYSFYKDSAYIIDQKGESKTVRYK